MRSVGQIFLRTQFRIRLTCLTSKDSSSPSCGRRRRCVLRFLGFFCKLADLSLSLSLSLSQRHILFFTFFLSLAHGCSFVFFSSVRLAEASSVVGLTETPCCEWSSSKCCGLYVVMLYTLAHTRIHTHLHTHAYTHTCTHTHTHTLAHTHLPRHRNILTILNRRLTSSIRCGMATANSCLAPSRHLEVDQREICFNFFLSYWDCCCLTVSLFVPHNFWPQQA